MSHKILFINNSFPAPLYKRFWKKITSLASEDYYIFVISPWAQKDKKYVKKIETYQNIQIFYYQKRENKNTPFSLFFSELIDFFKVFFISLKIYLKNRFKVIHVVNPTDSLSFIGIFFKIFQCFFIYENNECCYEKYKIYQSKNTFLDKIWIWLLKMMEKISLRFSDLIIVPDIEQKKRIIKSNYSQKTKIITIKPFPDLKDFYQPFVNQDFKMGFKKMILYSGSLRLGKGLDLLLTVISFIIKELKRRDILFVLAGEGRDRLTIKKYFKNQKINNFVYLPGWLNQEKLLLYLTTCDAGIVIENEVKKNFYQKDALFEFLAVGKPVISFNRLISKTLVGESVSTVETKNEILLAKAIIKVIDNKERKKKMGQIGQLKVNKYFNWLKSEIKLISIYDKFFKYN